MGSFPPITFVIFIVGLVLFFTGKVKQLAYLASISFIFHAAYISPFLTRIRPHQLIYALFILLILIHMLLSSKNSIRFSKKFDKPLIFAFYIIPASILANILAAGELASPAHSTGFGSTVQSGINALVPIAVNSAILSQNLYIFFPIVIFYCLRKLDADILNKCINYFIYSVAFLTMWNLFNLIELIVFNGTLLTDITRYLVGREGGYGSTSGFGFTRIGGFVGEPSHYAYVTLPAFGYVMGKSITDIKYKKKWYMLALLFLFGLIISFSTSGFASIIIFMTIYSLYNFKRKIYIYMTLFLIVIIVTGAIFFGEYLNAFIQYNMAKITLGQGSFAIRIWSVKHNLILFLKYPFLGIGIGSGGALGGIVTVLTNIGIIGMGFLFFSFRGVFPIYSKGILFAFYALIIYNGITGDLSTFFSPIFALLFAYASKNKLRKLYSTRLRFI